MTDKIFDFCKECYTSTYNSSYADFIKSRKSAKDVKEKAERFAQKFAIRTALKKGAVRFPNIDVSVIWKNVYKAHILRKSGLTIDEETVSKVISAEQSWRKSSGHAFEELIKEISNLSLDDTGIEIVLQ